MADLATPSAATMSTIDAGSEPVNASAKPHVQKPEKPEEEQFQIAVEKSRKEVDDARSARDKLQERVRNSTPNKDSPLSQKRDSLRAELATIRQKQSVHKTARGSTQEKVKALDGQLKARIAEQNAAKGRIPFKSVEEIDREIAKLEKQVDSGTMKLVDEKKALSDVTSLRKQRKAFGSITDQQKAIDGLKLEIAELRKDSDKPEYKALSDEYNRIQAELDTLQAEQDKQYKGLNATRDELKKARDLHDSKFKALKQIRDDHYAAKQAWYEYDREARKQREVKRAAENKAYQEDKRRRALEERLEEASLPAYEEEISASTSVLRLLDPTLGNVTQSVTPNAYAATAQRIIDDSGMKGTKLSKKDELEESYFAGTVGKKGRKVRKGAAADGETKSKDAGVGHLWSPSAIEQFSKLGIEPPTSRDQIPSLSEMIQNKKEFWLGDRKRKTEENVANARKEFEQHESTTAASKNGIVAHSAASTTAATTQSSAPSETAPTTDRTEERVDRSAAELSQGVQELGI